jgi:hypothetical protein
MSQGVIKAADVRKRYHCQNQSVIGKFVAGIGKLIAVRKLISYLEKMELLFLSRDMPIVWVITRRPG